MKDFDKNKAAIGELLNKVVVGRVDELKAELQEDFTAFVNENSPVDHENMASLKSAVVEAEKSANELVKKKIKKRKDKHLRKELNTPVVAPQKIEKDKDEAKETISEHFMFSL